MNALGFDGVCVMTSAPSPQPSPSGRGGKSGDHKGSRYAGARGSKSLRPDLRVTT
jgi:hypothetical protein